ncbi:MAG: hypothetical protein ACJ788_09075 [Ktedonobacteraceae bacterium]
MHCSHKLNNADLTVQGREGSPFQLSEGRGAPSARRGATFQQGAERRAGKKRLLQAGEGWSMGYYHALMIAPYRILGAQRELLR